MSLYLRHKRHGKHGSVSESVSKEPPASIKHFQSDLKNLAEGLKQFETAEPVNSQPSPSEPPRASFFSQEQPPQQQTPTHQPPAPTVNHSPAVHSSVTQSNSLGDPKVRALVLWTQERFNLSSESEALRLLVTIGQEQIEKLFPR